MSIPFVSYMRPFVRSKAQGALFILLILVSSFGVPSVRAVSYGPHLFPKKVNYFLKWELSEPQAKQLAKWDVVILDMEIQARHADLLKKMRVWNPDIVLLVYITPQEIRQDALSSFSLLRRQLARRIDDAWYLTDPNGKRLTWWPGTYLLNMSKRAPVVDGVRFNHFLADFVTDNLLSTGLWDGVYYDNAWDNISYFVNKSPIDYNRDGAADADVDVAWQEGMRELYRYTRERVGKDMLIVGNNITTVYANELNGMMIENFETHDWSDTMTRYAYLNDHTTNPPFRLNLINANTGNSGKQSSYRAFRFGLGSALMENGYYSFDHGDQDHGQLWWYDEYDVSLGEPIGDAASVSNKSVYSPDVWRRDFEHGVALVNSGSGFRAVELNGEFEKIHGTQDTKMNDGAIVSNIGIPEKDGVILLKTFDTLRNVLFPNGSFARFFHAGGDRVRNGFFVFEDGYKGGQDIAHIDMDGNGKPELLVVSKNKITMWRDDGQLYMKIYPYTASYGGTLKTAIGDLDGDGKKEVVVAPGEGSAEPIRIYSRHGRQKLQDVFPFGTSYTGGYSLAIGKFYGGETAQLVVGAGVGREPLVTVYDATLVQLKQWLAFEPSFRGGISVAAGDVIGDLASEVVVGAGPGKKPIIRIFDKEGKELTPSFTAYTSFTDPGIDVRVLDVDFDGKDDIVALSSGVGL